MRTILAGLLVALLAITARADDTVARAQQTLKDGGFYFGQVTGQKDADTSAAIRRYQIRNGLEVTGDLNDETLKALRNATAAATPRPAPGPGGPPLTAETDTSDLRAETDHNVQPNYNAAPQQPFNFAPPRAYGAIPPNQQADPMPPGNGKVVPSTEGLFGGTPYAAAPAEVQRKVVTDAKITLNRKGMYRGELDGYYGEDLEFSLRAYQSRVGLPVTGRLDLQTLAALELLPGARRSPVYVAPRRGPIPPGMEPPVRGEWIRP